MTERDKDHLLREFAAKMQEIRGMQPTEAGIQALKKDVEFLLNVGEGDTGQSRRVWFGKIKCKCISAICKSEFLDSVVRNSLP